MNIRQVSEALGEIDSRYIEEAMDYQTPKVSVPRGKRWLLPLAAVLMTALLLGSAVAAVVLYGDLWRQNPSSDPVESVRAALENQAGKDYTISIDVKSVEVDQAETERVVERFIKGVIAERRDWSDEYLAEHFVVVKAVYDAQYDHARTTRSDGEVTMYFYLAQDVDSGAWTIVDNSGNVNLAEPDPQPTAGESGPPVVLSAKEQIYVYLSNLFIQAFSPYYDGLHYEMIEYEETTDEKAVTATFIWREYYLGKGWDIGTDEGVEQMVNYHLQVVAAVGEDGVLDLETASILEDDHSVRGNPHYSIPVEKCFPKQPATLSAKEQIFAHLSDMFTKAYSPYYDGLHYEMNYYEETADGNQVTATFVWTMYFLGKGWDIGTDEGAEQLINCHLQIVATVGEDSTLDFETASILMDNSGRGGPNYSTPIEELFPDQLAD